MIACLVMIFIKYKLNIFLSILGFFAALRSDSVSLLRFPFLSHVKDFSREISLIWRLKYTYFSSHFCFLHIAVLLIPMLFIVFLVVMNLSLLLMFWIFICSFWCSFRVILSMYRCNLSFWQVLFFLPFWTHKASLFLYWYLGIYASS